MTKVHRTLEHDAELEALRLEPVAWPAEPNIKGVRLELSQWGLVAWDAGCGPESDGTPTHRLTAAGRFALMLAGGQP